MLWLRYVLYLSLLLVWGSPASAHTVALLRPPSHSPATTELLERLRGELLSVGFEVTVRDRPDYDVGAGMTEAWQRTLAAEAQCEAVIDVIEVTPLAVDVWVSDGAESFQLLARVKGDAHQESSSKGLAIRASEVLRARLFEPPVHEREQPPRDATQAPTSTVIAVEPETNQSSGPLGFELGAAVLTSLDGVGPALLPMFRFDWAFESQLGLQATLAGLGTRPNVATTTGEAEVAMQYGLLGACYRVNWQHGVRPLAALALGALHTAVVGQAELPREGHSVAQWSFLLDASLGASFPLSPRYAVVLAAHAQLAQPYVAIHFGDQRVASSGRPNLLLSLTFGAWP